MDLDAFLNIITETKKDQRKKYHLTLGDLIEFLEAAEQDAVVTPAVYEPHSYRGYYDDLSLTPRVQETTTVERLLAELKDVLGKELEGYKGGECLMSEDTPLWLSSYGKVSGIAIVDVQNTGNEVHLICKEIDH